MKPLTYMNESGLALRGLRATEPGAPLEHLLVLVDDFALPAGTFRIRGSGSAGGHNGLKSIEARIGTRHYARLRIGVGPLPRGLDGWRDFVLEEPTREERAVITELMPLMCEAVECWLEEGTERAMARYNRKAAAAPEEPEA